MVSECPDSHRCEDKCLPYPGGYVCSCNPGREPNPDQNTCKGIKGKIVQINLLKFCSVIMVIIVINYHLLISNLLLECRNNLFLTVF